jgi:hypothetical protein
MLENLGINTNLGDRLDPYGNPLPKDYNPFGRKFSALAELSELYVAGATYAGQNQILFEDLETADTWDPLPTDKNPSWTTLKKESIGADIDGDGYDEIVIVYYVAKDNALKAKILDWDGDEYRLDDQTYNLWSNIEYSDPKFTIDAGNIDGDANDEIVIGWNRDLWVFDDDFSLIVNKKFSPVEGHVTTNQVVVRTGDLDGDRKDEIGVLDWIVDWTVGTSLCKYVFYKGTNLTELDSGILQAASDAVVFTMGYGDLAIGDIDGDRFDEIVFTGFATALSSAWFVTMIMDDARAGFTMLDKVNIHLENSNEYHFTAEVLDVDGDGRKEFFTSNSLFEDLKESKGEIQTIGAMAPVFGSAINTVGDFNGDQREDLLLFNTIGNTVCMWGYDETSVFSLLSFIETTSPTDVTLTAANVDKDSAVYKYLDQKELLFSDPTIIAVMASPPYYKDIGQNVTMSSTTFGQSTGTTVNTERSIGFNVGFSIGAEFEAPLLGCTAVCGNVKGYFKAGMDWISSSYSSITKSYSYSSGPLEDKVVFTAIPFDVYYYKIISSPYKEDVGQVITINIPRDPQTLSVSRKFYNKNNGDNMDVDEKIFRHDIGDPWSYPDVQTKNNLLSNGGVASDVMTVGEGSGLQTITIDISNGEGMGNSIDLEVGIDSEITTGGVQFGMSVGFHYGFTYKIQTENTTFYEGVIGDIPAENYSAFTVNYWVQP